MVIQAGKRTHAHELIGDEILTSLPKLKPDLPEKEGKYLRASYTMLQ